VEPPPPRRAARPGPPPGGIPYDADSGPPLIHPDLGQGGNPQAELELQRQLEAEFGASGEAEAPAEPVPTPVPKDLIDDIESFKHTLRQGGDEPPKRAAKPQAEQDPTKLRLTAEQQAELPPFLMTVHVFDQDAAKRFVVINGQKYREGDKTREGLKVERILADGAVLGFRSGSFYQHR
jgi:general secretion pathway protein B